MGAFSTSTDCNASTNSILSNLSNIQLNNKQIVDRLTSQQEFLQTENQQLKNKITELEDEVLELKAKLLSLGVVENDKSQNTPVSQYKGSLFNLNATPKSDKNSTDLTAISSTQFPN
ncbi:hypothetical protein [Legionella busanensis]|uniref:hypothetical protein n=1 Tax=Legionella busanensis TaxID=190655 RepID=UPI000E1C1878|nr:hypothetical protein [Legionella busanensis]